MAPLSKPLNTTENAIYQVYIDREKATKHERPYLGFSIIGEECERRLWYAFRWTHEPEQFDGRMLRLFDTGHREESRIVEDLKAAGIDIHECDMTTGEQWAVAAVGGHARGHLDGIIFSGVPEAPKACHVFECKTHSVKSFRELLAKGVAEAKPMHMAQMQSYMHLKGIDRALYVAVEKDTDTIYTERVHYDAGMAIRLMAKADRIIGAQFPPAKIHEDPTKPAAFKCQWCPALSVCHGGSWPRMNCRTCLHATPVMNGDGTWHCQMHGRELSIDDQKAGCAQHLFIPDLVPGKQTDADPDANTVTYLLPSGETWVDGSGKAGGAQ